MLTPKRQTMEIETVSEKFLTNSSASPFETEHAVISELTEIAEE